MRAAETELRSSLNDLSGTPADRLLEARRKALDLDWLKLPPAEGFGGARRTANGRKAASLRLVRRCMPQAAARDRGPG